jgi:beta-phosphoglucomutase-like phosphatase (HAD superfamily)
LDYLKAEKIDRCIASSGLMKNVQLILEKLNVEEYFSHLVSGEMVTNGKPSPDIFLQAAGHFSTKSSNCVVIEDSRNGVEAARSANMNCIGYINEGSGNQDLSKADLIVDSLIDQRLFEFIKT